MQQAARSTHSRPVFDQTITIHSNHAQRLLDRGFLLVVRALYCIDVVLRWRTFGQRWPGWRQRPGVTLPQAGERSHDLVTLG